MESLNKQPPLEIDEGCLLRLFKFFYLYHVYEEKHKKTEKKRVNVICSITMLK